MGLMSSWIRLRGHGSRSRIRTSGSPCMGAAAPEN